MRRKRKYIIELRRQERVRKEIRRAGKEVHVDKESKGKRKVSKEM